MNCSERISPAVALPAGQSRHSMPDSRPTSAPPAAALQQLHVKIHLLLFKPADCETSAQIDRKTRGLDRGQPAFLPSAR